MTRHFRHFAATFVLLFSLTLLCGCQAGGMAYILPEFPSESTFQWKEALVKELNSYSESQYSQPDHYLHGSDALAEEVFSYLFSASGNNATRAAKLLSEGTDERIVCAPALLGQLTLDSDKSYLVSYAILPNDALKDGVLQADKLSAVAADLYEHRGHLLLLDSFSDQNCEVVGFTLGTIGGNPFLVMVSVS